MLWNESLKLTRPHLSLADVARVILAPENRLTTIALLSLSEELIHRNSSVHGLTYISLHSIEHFVQFYINAPADSLRYFTNSGWHNTAVQIIASNESDNLSVEVSTVGLLEHVFQVRILNKRKYLAHSFMWLHVPRRVG